jgi:hypothetical protein
LGCFPDDRISFLPELEDVAVSDALLARLQTEAHPGHRSAPIADHQHLPHGGTGPGLPRPGLRCLVERHAIVLDLDPARSAVLQDRQKSIGALLPAQLVSRRQGSSPGT